MNLRSIPKTCDQKGCDKPPTKQLRLSLAVNANHPPAISTPIAYACDEHQHLFTFEEFAEAGSNWDSLCKQFESIGRVAPKKEFSKLIIEDISHES